MTPTANAPASLTLQRLDELAELEKTATPGPWEVWSSNSHLRLTAPDGPDGGVCSAMVASDGVPVLAVRRSNIDLIAAMRNDLPALLAAARELLSLRSALEFLREGGFCCEGPDYREELRPEEMMALAMQHGWLPPEEQETK